MINSNKSQNEDEPNELSKNFVVDDIFRQECWFSFLFYFTFFCFLSIMVVGGGGEEFFSRKTNSLKYTFYFFPDYFGFCCCCCWISILLSKPSVTWLYIVDDCRPCAAAAAVMSVATVPRLMMSTALPVIYGHSFQHFILCGACR